MNKMKDKMKFEKYNLSPSGYETFIYYDEVDGLYIQFMYAGYKKQNEYELLNETFTTNYSETNVLDKQNKIEKIYSNVHMTITNIPSYIGEMLLQHCQ